MYVRRINDLGKKRCSPHTALDLVNFFRIAIGHDLSVSLSAKYAILRKEREMWHQSSIDVKKKGWRSLTRIDSSVERFVSLVNSPFYSDLTIQDFISFVNKHEMHEGDRIEDRIIKFFIRNLKFPGPKGRQLETSRDNYKRVVGKCSYRVVWELVFSPGFRNEWKEVKRGRDLFTLGKFNIQEALNKLERDCVTPSSISSEAYGIDSVHYYQLMLKRPAVLEYVRRHITWWRLGDNLNRIDEIVLNHDFFFGRRHLSPPKLLEVMEEDITLRTRRAVTMSDKWDWVENAFKEVKTKYGTLIPITTSDELEEVGEEMDNCASAYAYNIQIESTLFVYLYKDTEIKALCEYGYPGEVRQCLGPSNARVSAEVRKLFKEHAPKF